MTRLRLYCLAALCGGLLMALEILASRIIAPYFGNSVYIWGSIISVFLAALALGYAWGGRIADRHPDLEVLGRLIVLAGFWLLALRLGGTRAAEWLADATSGSPAGTLVTASLLFGPPSLLFGTVSPFVVRLAARDFARLGDTAGRLYAVSTLGSLAGTLLCTFVAIPAFPVPAILAALTAGTAGTALVALAAPRRPGYATVAAALLLVAGLSFRGAPALGRGEVVAVHSSPYQTLEVVERAGVRSIRSDRVTQSAIHVADGSVAAAYAHYAAAAFLVHPAPRRALVIGMGGGLVARPWRRLAPELEVDFVEIDAVVPRIAQQYGFWTPHPRDRVHIADGRQFLRRSAESWDLIYVDAYIGLAVPFHLTTREFFALAAAHLEPGGVLAVNLAAGLEDPFSRSLLHTVRRAFRSTVVIGVRGAGNVLVLASAGGPSLPEAIRRRATEIDDSGLRIRLAEIAGDVLQWDYETADLVELSDDYAPAEHLVVLGNRDFDLAVVAPQPSR
ncbi:MAG: fused MFS/spermidine synthase [Acidobacteriota bacterium]|nr:fused MFS/spermidine synthase [Acidobacteriota bacterium]